MDKKSYQNYSSETEQIPFNDVSEKTPMLEDYPNKKHRSVSSKYSNTNRSSIRFFKQLFVIKLNGNYSLDFRP